MAKYAFVFFHKHLFTILAITFEPFKPFSCITTHLKAKNPLYKDHLGPHRFFQLGNIGKMVYVPRSVVNFGGFVGNDKVSNNFYQCLVIKNKIPLVTITQVLVSILQHQKPLFFKNLVKISALKRLKKCTLSADLG